MIIGIANWPYESSKVFDDPDDQVNREKFNLWANTKKAFNDDVIVRAFLATEVNIIPEEIENVSFYFRKRDVPRQLSGVEKMFAQSQGD